MASQYSKQEATDAHSCEALWNITKLCDEADVYTQISVIYWHQNEPDKTWKYDHLWKRQFFASYAKYYSLTEHLPFLVLHRAFSYSLFNKTNLCTIIVKHTKTLSLLKV
jgi:hypothetical protein